MFYRRWFEKGIYYVNDLLNMHGDFMSLNELQNKLNLQTNFLQYQSILNSIRTFLRGLDLEDLHQRLCCPFMPLTLTYILKDIKGCKTIYDMLLKSQQKPHALQKWQNEILFPENFNWENVFNLPFRISKDTQLRWFQYRINHRILGTNYILEKMNKVESSKCTFCQEETETIEHIFYECREVSPFWNQFKTYIRTKGCISCSSTQWNKIDILFGNTLFDTPLNLLLIKAKQFIYSMKMKNIVPVFANFKISLLNFYRVEEYIAKKNCKIELFNKEWNGYRGLFNNDLE